jgi:hypothetical protein
MNKNILKIATVALALSVVFAVTGFVSADEWNRKTIFSVSHPFQVPGAVLEPDTTYVMELMDSASARHVVRLFNSDESELIATFSSTSAYRHEPEDNTVLSFINTEEGYPLPIRQWFYPGKLSGLEFIYSDDQSEDIARHATGAVAMTAENFDDVKLADLDTTEVVGVHPDDLPAATMTAENEPTRFEVPSAEDGRDEGTEMTREDNGPVEVEKEAEIEIERAKPAEPQASPASPASPDRSSPDSENLSARPSANMPVESDTEESQAEGASASETLPSTAGALSLLGLLGAALAGIGFLIRR